MDNKCTICFTGDIGFDRYMDKAYDNNDLFSEDIISFLNDSDYTVTNIEGALIDKSDTGSHGSFFHANNPDCLKALKKINANIWTIANNHIMDVGEEGLLSTMAIAKANGYQTLGADLDIYKASKPLIINKAGGIGIISLAYMKECIPATKTSPGVFPWDEMELIETRIKEIKKKCRWCIVIVHGGEEFACLPSPYTRDRYLEYLKMGVDIIVGHHPHVVENYEIIDNKAIFYSLGNFIFDTDYQRVHPYTDQGVLLKLKFTEDNMEFSHLGIRIDRNDHIVTSADAPLIFTDINGVEYEKLKVLNAICFLREEKKKMAYLEPERFGSANDKDWLDYFHSKEPDGYDEGKHMDLKIIYELSKLEDLSSSSSLQDIVKYLKSE